MCPRIRWCVGVCRCVGVSGVHTFRISVWSLDEDGSYGAGSAHSECLLVVESMQDGSYGTGSAHNDFV